MSYLFNSYVAIIGDIIKSKDIRDRNDVQCRLKNILDEVNIKYHKDIASRFMITLGDEFQGLLNCGQNAMNIVNEIELQMYPIKIRFGIGVGEITTDINYSMPIGADGPAYHNARSSIEKLKSSEKKSKAIESNIFIMSDNETNSIDTLINAVLSLTTAIKSKWTLRQAEIIKLCFESGDNQTKLADKLDVRQVTIHKALSSSKYYTYKNAIETVSEILSQIKVD